MSCSVKRQSVHPSTLPGVPCHPLGPPRRALGSSPRVCHSLRSVPLRCAQMFTGAHSSAERCSEAKDYVWLALECPGPGTVLPGYASEGTGLPSLLPRRPPGQACISTLPAASCVSAGHRRWKVSQQEDPGGLGPAGSLLCRVCQSEHCPQSLRDAQERKPSSPPSSSCSHGCLSRCTALEPLPSCPGCQHS